MNEITPKLQERAYCIEAADKDTALIKADELLLNSFCADKSGCGECSGCRRYLNRVHPDLLLIDGSGEDSKTERLRETVLPFANRGAYEAGVKAIIITDADKLHIAAQNALLKILEEPPTNTIFVLTTAKKHKLLPTVLSRCIILKAYATIKDPIAELSAFGLDAIKAEILLKAARGDFNLAKRLAQNKYFNLRDNIIEGLDSLWRSNAYAVGKTEQSIYSFENAEKPQSSEISSNTAKNKAVKNSDIEKTLEIALIYIQDVINYKYGSSEIANTDRIDYIKKHSRLNDLKLALTSQKFAEFIQKMDLCKGINIKLGITAMLFDILEGVL